MSEFKVLDISSKLSTKQRFIKFIEFYLPHGKGGLNEFVGDNYSADAPYLLLTKRFMRNGLKTIRVSAIKCEYKSDKVINGKSGKVINPEGFISEPFKSFFKAWVNAYLYYSRLTTAPRDIVIALRYIEKQIRDFHGNNAPWHLTSEIAYLAANQVKNKFRPGSARQICQHIELLISMLNDGTSMGRYNYYSKGFNLFKEPFSFKNPIKYKRRKQVLSIDSENNITFLTDEDINCIVRAYAVSKSRYGTRHYLTYLAALCALPIICSLRISEIFSLSLNSLFLDDKDNRWKLRVYRYKNDYVDDVPIPQVLVEFARDVFLSIQEYSEGPRNALKNYMSNECNISEIPFIKCHNDDISNIDYIPIETLKRILNREKIADSEFIRTFSSRTLIDALYGINIQCDFEGDIRSKYYHIEDVAVILKCNNIYFSEISKYEYVSIDDILGSALIGKTKLVKVLASINFYRPKAFFSKSDYFYYLERVAMQHIKTQCIHYPFADRNKYLRLDDALCVSYRKSMSAKYYAMHNLPELSKPYQLNQFISSGGNGVSNSKRRNLFRILGVKKRDGSYPDFTIHATRKYHQTSALLRGASVIICDRLAGRQTGFQSDHYDLRTVDQRLERSIEFFDPTSDYEVIGSDAEIIPNDPINRKKFLQDNVSPKHTHEYGGCISDWSLNPCENYGGCMTCGCHEWMKGDELKFEFIVDLYESKIKELASADHLIQMGNNSVPILKHRQQIVDVINRCNQIFDIESDDNIKFGTLVIFSKADAAFTTADHVNFLRSFAARGDNLNAL